LLAFDARPSSPLSQAVAVVAAETIPEVARGEAAETAAANMACKHARRYVYVKQQLFFRTPTKT